MLTRIALSLLLLAACTAADVDDEPSAAQLESRARCLFGTSYHDLFTARDDLRIVAREPLRADTPLTPLGRKQVVRAVKPQHRVHSVAQAFAAVANHQIDRVFVWDPAGRRSFVAYQYDGEDGVLFPRDSLEVVASMHQGALHGCRVHAETCLLGQEYPQLLEDPAFVVLSARRITDAAQLTGDEAAQALAAVRRIHPEATTLDQAIHAADDEQLNLTRLLHVDTAAEFLAIEFGAGDTSVGTVYALASGRPAAFIDDGGFDACAVFLAR
jgi:hypothetical protein